MINNKNDLAIVIPYYNARDHRFSSSGLRKQVKEVVVSFNEKLIEDIPASKLNTFFEVMEIIDENIEDELKAINRFF